MLLIIHNLPYAISYSDLKSLLQSKCGISSLVLDNLLSEGITKRVTVGVSDEADAAIVVRNINGLYMDGQHQLYVEEVRKKRQTEQPFRTSTLLDHQQMHPERTEQQTQPAMDQSMAAQTQYMMQNSMSMTNDSMTRHCMPQTQDPNSPRQPWSQDQYNSARNDDNPFGRQPSPARTRNCVEPQSVGRNRQEPSVFSRPSGGNHPLFEPPLCGQDMSRPERLCCPDPYGNGNNRGSGQNHPTNSPFNREQMSPRFEEPCNRNEFSNGQQISGDDPPSKTTFKSARFSDGKSYRSREPPVKKSRPSHPPHSDIPAPKGLPPLSLEKKIRRDDTWKGQAAAEICKSLVQNVQKEMPFVPARHQLKALKQAIRIRIDVILGDKIGVHNKEMVVKYRDKYGPSTDIKLFNLVMTRVNKEKEAAIAAAAAATAASLPADQPAAQEQLQAALDSEMNAIEDILRAEATDPQDNSDIKVCKHINDKTAEELKNKICRLTEILQLMCRNTKSASQSQSESALQLVDPFDGANADIHEDIKQINKGNNWYNEETSKSDDTVDEDKRVEHNFLKDISRLAKLLRVLYTRIKYTPERKYKNNVSDSTESVENVHRSKYQGDGLITPSQKSLLIQNISVVVKMLRILHKTDNLKRIYVNQRDSKNTTYVEHYIEQIQTYEIQNRDIGQIRTSDLSHEDDEHISTLVYENTDTAQSSSKNKRSKKVIKQIPISRTQIKDGEPSNNNIKNIPTTKQNETITNRHAIESHVISVVSEIANKLKQHFEICLCRSVKNVIARELKKEVNKNILIDPQQNENVGHGSRLLVRKITKNKIRKFNKYLSKSAKKVLKSYDLSFVNEIIRIEIENFRKYFNEHLLNAVKINVARELENRNRGNQSMRTADVLPKKPIYTNGVNSISNFIGLNSAINNNNLQKYHVGVVQMTVAKQVAYNCLKMVGHSSIGNQKIKVLKDITIAVLTRLDDLISTNEIEPITITKLKKLYVKNYPPDQDKELVDLVTHNLNLNHDVVTDEPREHVAMQTPASQCENLRQCSVGSIDNICQIDFNNIQQNNERNIIATNDFVMKSQDAQNHENSIHLLEVTLNNYIKTEGNIDDIVKREDTADTVDNNANVNNMKREVKSEGNKMQFKIDGCDMATSRRNKSVPAPNIELKKAPRKTFGRKPYRYRPYYQSFYRPRYNTMNYWSHRVRNIKWNIDETTNVLAQVKQLTEEIANGITDTKVVEGVTVKQEIKEERDD